MKRPRPYIPISVRVQIAERQCCSLPNPKIIEHKDGKSLRPYLEWLLANLAFSMDCAPERLELHHRPALINRPFNKRTGKYTPDANDPDGLIYLEKSDHRIETHVRGINGQFSDMMLRQRERNRKCKAKRKTKSFVKRKWISRNQAKRIWPSRPFPKRST